MEHIPKTDWYIYQSRLKEMNLTDERLKHASDAKCIKIAEEIAYLRSKSLPYEAKEKELQFELNCMFMNTRILNGKMGAVSIHRDEQYIR